MVAYVLLSPGGLQPHTRMYGVEFANVGVLAGWVFFVWRLASSLFSGPRARGFLVTTMILVVVLCLWFGWSLHISLAPAELLEKGPQ